MKRINYEIINGDALEEMAKLPNASIDAVITDPPYCSGGISETSRVAAKGQGLRSENLVRFGWFVGDNMTTSGLVCLLRIMAVEATRIVKSSGSILIFCDWRMLHTLVPAIESAGLRYQGLIVWDKGHFGMGNGFRCQHELIMHFTCGKPEYYSKSFGNVLQSKRVNAAVREHQTQKPVDLLSDLLQVVTDTNQIILDPFMGSGSTGVACIKKKRRFVGIEKSKEHFDTAKARIKRANLEPCDIPQMNIPDKPMPLFELLK